MSRRQFLVGVTVSVCATVVAGAAALFGPLAGKAAAAISLDEFIQRYTGVGIDFDGAYGFQCVDLYRRYAQEVLNYPQSPPVQGADDIWNAYLPDYFDRIANSPTNVPNKGDIVIWNATIAANGHIAVAYGGNSMSFTSFDQNFPIGSLPHLQPHSYASVLGWLRPKRPAAIRDAPEVLRGLGV